MTIGEKIRIARRLRNYTQAELGSMVKLPGDMIRKYENDVRTPKADRLTLIAEKLDIDISALSDINITSIEDILHIFFELEESYGLNIEKSDDNFILNINKSATNRELIYALDSWYEAQKKFIRSTSNEDDVLPNKNYALWKMRFPLDIKANELKQSELVQAKYFQLVQAIKEEQLEIRTFKDIILIFEAMIKAEIKIDLYNEHLGIGRELGIFYFSNTQLLSLESPISNLYANFLYAIKGLSDYGITIQQGSHSFEKETFTEYYIYNSQISTMIPTFRKLQEWVKENTLDDLEHLCKYKDTKQWMNVPIKEYV